MNDFTKSARYQKCQALFDRRYPDFRNAGERYQDLVSTEVSAQTRIFELGCGRTSLAATQIAGGACSIGLDPSLSDLQHNQSITYALQGDGASLPLASASVDLIVSQWVVEHLETPQLVFDEMARVLRPGGKVILFTTNANNYVPFASRLVPEIVQDFVLERMLRRPTHESFPTFFRANTRKSLAQLAAQADLTLESCTYNGNPFYLAFSPLLFRGALLFEKLTDHPALQKFKLYLLATLSKGV